MGYAGNQVNTQGALSNYLQASANTAAAHQAYGQAIGQGIQNIFQNSIQAYMAMRQLQNQTKDVDSTAKLRNAQTGHTEAITRGIDIDNKTRGKKNETEIKGMEADIGYKKAQTNNTHLQNQILQPTATIHSMLNKDMQNNKTTYQKAISSVGQNFVKGKLLGTKDANYADSINDTTQAQQPQSSNLNEQSKQQPKEKQLVIQTAKVKVQQ